MAEEQTVTCDMALTHSRRSSREAGFTLIDTMFVVALVGLLSSLAIPSLVQARSAAQSASAIGTLHAINSGELSYAIGCGFGFYSPDLPTLGVPPPGETEAFLPSELTAAASVIKSGYTISLAGTSLAGAPATCNGLDAGTASPSYAAVADMLDISGHTARYFGTNSEGVIYEDVTTFSLTMPESGQPPSGSPIK
jgi:type II secretory pathway pseudopilin PulG